MNQGENGTGEGIQRLTSTIGDKLGEGAQKTELFSSACIHRVPKDLRKVNKSAYTPWIITIVFLHWNDKQLQTPPWNTRVKMNYKINNLLCLLTVGLEDQQESAEKKSAVLHECLAEMKKSINDAKKYYIVNHQFI